MLNITFLFFFGGQEYICLFVFLFVTFLFVKGKKHRLRGADGSDEHAREIKDENKNNEIKLLPDTCPHCKSPNTKKIRLCEWCGNQIV